MSDKKFTIRLTESDITSLINQLQQYKNDLKSKCDTLRQRIADDIQTSALMDYMGSLYQVQVRDGAGGWSTEQIVPRDIRVDVQPGGENITIVVASGLDVLFIEFGTGVTHNGAAGTSPHPASATHPNLVIGGYGKGHGKQNRWYFSQRSGRSQVTYRTEGFQSNPALYNAAQDVRTRVLTIAKEVFG